MTSTTLLFSTVFLTCVLLSTTIPRKAFDYTLIYDDYSESEEHLYEEIQVRPEGGFIESEGYPKNYPSNSRYLWTLTAPPEGRLRLIITDMRLEPCKNCSCDYLALYDGGNTKSKKIAQLCDQRNLETPYSSTGPQMTLQFISDANYEEPGFHVEFIIEMGNQCNTTLTNREGTIMSPNYPNNYPDKTDCYTIIKAQQPEEQVLISINTVKLEYGESCDYDYVEIFDRIGRNAKSLGRFCDTPPNSVILSTSGALLVHFHSDHLINNVGFSLTYTVIAPFKPYKNPDANDACLWEMDQLNGTIASPSYPDFYEPDEDCLFLLEAPLNQKISLTMGKIVMDGHENCNLDYVEVRDGHDIDSKLIEKFCGRPFDPRRTVTSTSNKMWVRFVSDSSMEFQGFIAQYKVVNKAPATSSCKYCHEHKEEQPLVVTTKPNNATLGKGAKHIFNCISNAETKPTWMKDFIPLQLGEQLSLPGLHLLTNNSVVIESMSWRLEGVYTCTIVSSKEIQVYNAWITYTPTLEERSCDIKFTVTPQPFTTVEGSYTFLRCSTETAYTQIRWMKDNVVLTENTDPRIRIILPGLVLIHPLLPHDTGNYKCTATKLDGCSRSVAATIAVQHKPEMGCGNPAIRKVPKKPHEELGKIVGGEKSVEGTNPWQAMLFHPVERHFCGGSIIDVEWVVTAAHCLKQFTKMLMLDYNLKIEDITIKLGRHDSQQYKEPNEQVFKIKEIHYHPQYQETTYDNDIALLHLDGQIEPNNYISPICIGDDQLLNDNAYTKQVLGVVSGWGRVKSGGLKPRYLREVSLPVVDQNTCIESVGGKYTVTDNMFCAGFAQEMAGDSCQGDSGGPFAVQIKGRWYLAGIVSWGEGCAAEGKYGFYTKVGNYYNWFLDTMQQGALA